ncbi:MAG: 4Fe-4S dicluster domain-containing protein [Alphaproteobacteria bacterium]|nr:4Fe-4S dicluster domain-containing protein [Alphaproteobacteria bacterium]
MSATTSRRAFLAAASAAVATLAPGITLIAAQAKPADQPASSSVRWGMLIDTTRCSQDCSACVGACNVENGLGSHGRPQTDPQWIRKVDLTSKRTGQKLSLPVMCQHCESPPCVDVCPTGASFKRQDGIVLVDRHICIGCRYCMMACPYKARSFVHESLENQRPHQPRGKGCVEGCNLCAHRVDEGKRPACAEACASGAILFGDLNDPKSEIAQKLRTLPTTQIRPELKLNTAVRYGGLSI